MNAKFHHLAISVCDMDRMISFYTDVLGFEVDWDMDHRGGEKLGRVVGLPNPDAHIVMMKGYGARIELFKYHSPAGESHGNGRQCDFGFTHFALQVKNIHGLYDHLISAGARFNCPPQSLRPGVWATYMKDTEGNTIELVEYEQKGAND